MLVESLTDTPYNRALARGHRIRNGHDMRAVQASSDGILWHNVMLCCGETIPIDCITAADLDTNTTTDKD